MARRKTLPESVRAKLALAERLAALRSELYGDRGGPEMARRLGIPVRTWYNYEGGVTVPAEVILKIIELTAVEAGVALARRGTEVPPSSRSGARSAVVRPRDGRRTCSGRPSSSSKRTSRAWPGATTMMAGPDQLDGAVDGRPIGSAYRMIRDAGRDRGRTRRTRTDR